MMSKFAIIFLLMIFNSVCFGQTNPKVLLDAVIKRTKEVSLYSSKTNWDELEKQVYAKAENAKTVDDLKPAFETLLNGLGDKHGSILNAKNYSPIARFTDWQNLNHPDKRPRENEVWKAVNDKSVQQFSYKILQGKVGYLKIVGIAPNVNLEAESKKIRAAVVELSGKNIKKWIIDLRYNGGGNMNPMMTGIAPLIGDGIVGSLVNLKGEKIFDWEIKDSNFIYGGAQWITLPNEPKFKKLPKIAVLTSRWTVSSGEIVATALKGRPNTKFFGEMTGGLTTNNGWDIIDNEVIINISTGIFADRNGMAYQFNIPVDVEIPFKVTAETEQDECVIAAKKWLKK
jgi:carboxyl-terminal processing protease